MKNKTGKEGEQKKEKNERKKKVQEHTGIWI